MTNITVLDDSELDLVVGGGVSIQTTSPAGAQAMVATERAKTDYKMWQTVGMCPCGGQHY